MGWKIAAGFALGIVFMVLPLYASVLEIFYGYNMYAFAGISLVEVAVTIALAIYRPTRMVAVGVAISLLLSPIVLVGACFAAFANY